MKNKSIVLFCFLLTGCAPHAVAPHSAPEYQVGVDYHSYGADFRTTAFIQVYDQSAVRQTVQAQLQGMANDGASFIHTSIWFGAQPGHPDLDPSWHWQTSFPISDREAANLRSYAQDVAAVQAADGHRLRLDIAFMWIGASDYRVGSPETGLSVLGISASDFVSRVEMTTDKVLNAIGDVARPDGVHVVDTIFFGSELKIGGTPNEEWLITTMYPRFVSVVQARGFIPSTYFNIERDAAAVLDDGYVDCCYPALDGHGSMYWPYRDVKFFADHGLPIPPRIEFSCYLNYPKPEDLAAGVTYDELLQRILEDADVVLPPLGAPPSYAATETFYLTDPNKRWQYGQAFAHQAAKNPHLKRVSFWTTPDGGGTGQSECYPFSIGDFLQQGGTQ